jgi:hypothetical protein
MTPIKGLAMAHAEYPQDLDALNCAWYYTWGCDAGITDPRYVPMSRDGSIVDLPADYAGYLLVFNEPNLKEPNGCDVAPDEAAVRYRALIKAYPQAKMVVGGVSAWDSVYSGSWLKCFKSMITCLKVPRPYAYHVHGYVESWITAAHLKSWWTKQHTLLGGKLWITEYNDTGGNIANLSSLTSWIEGRTWIERYAAFTNRSHGEPWAIGDGVNLVDWETGALTASGKYYASVGALS